MDLGAPRLRLGMRPQRLRRAFGVIEAAAVAEDGHRDRPRPRPDEHGVVDSLAYGAHALAPFRIWRWDELHRNADALRAALLMHQHETVGRHDVLGAGSGVIA